MLPNRLARIQGHMPCTRIGGGAASTHLLADKETSVCDCMSVIGAPYRSVSAMRALNQFMAIEMMID